MCVGQLPGHGTGGLRGIVSQKKIRLTGLGCASVRSEYTICSAPYRNQLNDNVKIDRELYCDGRDFYGI